MRRAHRRLGIRGFLLQEVIPLLLGVGSLALYLSVAGRSALVLLTGTIWTMPKLSLHLGHQLVPEFQKGRLVQTLGEDVRYHVCRWYPLHGDF